MTFYAFQILPFVLQEVYTIDSYNYIYSSVGRYQYFTFGIRYYKFKTVFDIPRYFDQTQLTSYSWHFCINNVFNK